MIEPEFSFCFPGQEKIYPRLPGSQSFMHSFQGYSSRKGNLRLSITIIIELLMAAIKSDRLVQSYGLSPHFQKVFIMAGLNKYTHLHPDEATACAAFADGVFLEIL
ncbi:MAG: hypothetical protein ACYCPO_03775 [Acidobacteriaceae bacterium]